MPVTTAGILHFEISESPKNLHLPLANSESFTTLHGSTLQKPHHFTKAKVLSHVPTISGSKRQNVITCLFQCHSCYNIWLPWCVSSIPRKSFKEGEGDGVN